VPTFPGSAAPWSDAPSRAFAWVCGAQQLLVSGNHDVLSPDDTQGAVPLRSLLRFTELIDDELVTVELDSRDGLREVTIYGLPWQPQVRCRLRLRLRLRRPQSRTIRCGQHPSGSMRRVQAHLCTYVSGVV
jgi:hypothetical protein